MTEERERYKTEYTVPELAARAGLTPRRIRQLIEDQVIIARRVGRDYIVAASEAERWLKSR